MFFMCIILFSHVWIKKSESLPIYVLSLCLQNGKNVVYSKYAGTEIEFNGVSHVLLKEEDIVGVLETEDIQDLQPLNDRVLIKVIDCLLFCLLISNLLLLVL